MWLEASLEKQVVVVCLADSKGSRSFLSVTTGISNSREASYQGQGHGQWATGSLPFLATVQ